MIYPIVTDGVLLIKFAEGLRLKAYQDAGGKLTIGYGRTKNVKPTDTISELQAELFLVEDLLDTLKDISQYVKAPANAFQVAALSSFIFNLGGNKFRKSTLCRLLNEQKYSEASAQFERWIYGKNKQGNVIVLPGLVKRRKAERLLFESNSWDVIKKEVYGL